VVKTRQEARGQYSSWALRGLSGAGRIRVEKGVRNVRKVRLVNLNPKSKVSLVTRRPLSRTVNDNVALAIAFQFQGDVRFSRVKSSNAGEITIQSPNFLSEPCQFISIKLGIYLATPPTATNVNLRTKPTLYVTGRVYLN